MNLNAIKKILVIREGKIGDLLMITPTIEALAKRYPYSKIDLLINNYGSFVFENNPKIDEIIFYDRKNSFGKQIKLLHKLRKEEYDLIFIFEESSHHKILAYLIGGKIRVGFSGKHNQLLTHYFPWEKKHHAIDNNLKLLTPSLEKNSVLSKKMILNLKGSDLRKAKDFLKLNNISENDKIVFIHPACGKNEKLRTWPPENIAKFSDMLISSDNVKVILHCGPNEEEVINQILPLMKNKPVVNRNNLDITSALIKLSDVFVGPDTGTMHIADALDTPMIALFGASAISDCGPINSAEHKIIINEFFPCMPCQALPNSIERERCLNNKSAKCMEAIQPELVYKTAIQLVNEFSYKEIATSSVYTKACI